LSLTSYNRKRDFKRTPEPRSVTRPEKKRNLSFVVQKHDATRLHYDFRLEMNGVLKSWAIPKGPSMVSGDKRLAIMVEDHPLEYGKFYGEIPEGNYGAGTVEIWDYGTYRPITGQGDAELTLLGMLEKGDIKFSLNGVYLKGRFAIFRLKDSEKGNEWMLVKKADEFAEDAFDIESILPLKSKKKSEQGKAGKKVSLDLFPDPLPKPMLARLVDDVIENPSWCYEIKLDGYRIICGVRDGKVRLVSRGGNSYKRQFEALLGDLEKIEEEVILDGEVVAENSKGRSDFQLLQNYLTTGKADLKYFVFDILYLNGHNIMKFPLLKRKELLDAFFGKYDFKRVRKLDYQRGNGRELFQRLSREGYEGIIAKDPESAYSPGKRADSWLKIKSFQMQEALICGYTEPKGSRRYFGSVILGLFEDGKLKYVGNCGTGFSDALLKELHARFEHLKTVTSPFAMPPDLSWPKEKPVWIKPKLVASIKFMEWTADEIMRTPVFIALRDDKKPEEVVNESKNTTEIGSAGSNKNMRKDETLSLSGNTLRLTNLTKVFWPDEGYTKGDLISYYHRISKIILPYIRDRPQSMNRHPGGIAGESFYHKGMDVDSIPKWIRTVKMESGSHAEGINYLICNNVGTLIYMVNLGCIEINPWHSTYRKPELPSYMILDLDPGDVPFRDVVDTALVIKELCDEIKVPCFPKTSGASGLHIYFPLGEKYDYTQAKTFAELLAVLAHNRLPSATSLERAVSKRTDKVYIDFLQNRRGQTIASPYCVRPRAHATVSTPLDWKEVNHRLSPEMFTIKNTEKRLEKVGDLWQPVLKLSLSLTKALKAIEKIS
jgi:bifunctional non-homologous end joining protein LigD